MLNNHEKQFLRDTAEYGICRIQRDRDLVARLSMCPAYSGSSWAQEGINALERLSFMWDMTSVQVLNKITDELVEKTISAMVKEQNA